MRNREIVVPFMEIKKMLRDISNIVREYGKDSVSNLDFIEYNHDIALCIIYLNEISEMLRGCIPIKQKEQKDGN